MDNTSSCPICEKKLSSTNALNKDNLDKTTTYTERKCASMNHSIILLINDKTDKVDFIKMSLNPKYSRFIEIDFYNNKCRINCLKNGKPEYINIPKMIVPDFPELIKLKEKVGLFITFS
jgi:hypothetical protein